MYIDYYFTIFHGEHNSSVHVHTILTIPNLVGRVIVCLL
ncbi:hypothetical protein J2Z49_002990 [Desulfofundulus luciae]|uniref:Transposase n=1 Tax=Desulfofundulus luciae TaxID=74702 RepID=A0ABU0B6H8_9FIRM|nr:hypothetical protein [Desulfofundulus luciae]